MQNHKYINFLNKTGKNEEKIISDLTKLMINPLHQLKPNTILELVQFLYKAVAALRSKNCQTKTG